MATAPRTATDPAHRAPGQHDVVARPAEAPAADAVSGVDVHGLSRRRRLGADQAARHRRSSSTRACCCQPGAAAATQAAGCTRTRTAAAGGR